MAGALGRLSRREQQHHRVVADREVIAISLGLAVSACVITLVGWYRSRAMIRRGAVMADRLASGDLGARMPETGNAEIGRLGRSFNIMAASLEHSHRELTQFVETQTALRRVATLVARGVPPSDVMAAVAEELARLIGTDTSRIFRYEADGTTTVVAAFGRPDSELPVGTQVSLEGGPTVTALVLRTGRPARVDNFDRASGPLAAYARSHGIQAAVGAPIHVGGRLWGATTAASTTGEPPPPDAEARLAECTDLIGTAIANAQTHAELIASRARVVLATDQARRRIERDLHDGVQQRLVSLGLDVRRAEANVPPELDELRGQLSAVVTGLTGTVDDVREISRGVHPAILTEGGLRLALKGLARRSAVPVELDLRLQHRLPEPAEVAAYYVVTEALANAAKHARASLIRVSALVEDGCLSVSVRDDGVGGADPAHGSGLVGLTDRVEALGGTMTVDSPAQQGTLLRIRLPLADA
ncbi:histidine kinase [Dactylosporangium sp. AC04546]|uniref:GAF domain-containing protein n=1 Tax=Dactylosporangium sp. AC04546 TaxID=2862460 RepID=UPI001EDEDCE3|nr:GAF domain-containing protein [Dactylosporangium sp. AC04546]WVK80849.1 histidine kinase [Dactylosporangium sp. AC04546]